jgi:hypothetical protein
VPLKLTLQDAQILAQQKDGTCLSTKYEGANKKLQWRCTKHHIFEMAISTVKRGSWCKKCYNINRCKYTKEDAIRIAEERGGKFLSKTFLKVKDRYQWSCKEGHTWEAVFDWVNRGQWCKECSRGLSERLCRAYFEQLFFEKFPSQRPTWLRSLSNTQLELDGYCEKLNLAFEHQGLQHYKELAYFPSIGLEEIQQRDALKKQLCKDRGILLIAIPALFYKLQLAGLRKFIKKACLEASFGITTNFDHIEIDLRNAYSPQKLEELRDIAINKDGKLLTIKYTGVREKYLWECSKGHRWEAIADSVKRGSWCPICADTTDTLETYIMIAENKGGKCLSTTYVNCRSKLKFECDYGHTWLSRASHIKLSGTWCPHCTKQNGVIQKWRER